VDQVCTLRDGEPLSGPATRLLVWVRGAALSVRFENGPQPLDLLDERLQRLEFLAPVLALLYLSHPVGFLPRTQRVDNHVSARKDHPQKGQGKPPRLREQVAPHSSYRLNPLVHHPLSSAHRGDISPRFENLTDTPQFVGNRLQRL